MEREKNRGDLALLGSAARVEQRFRNRYGSSQKHYFDTVRPTDLADIVVYNDEPERPPGESGRTDRVSQATWAPIAGLVVKFGPCRSRSLPVCSQTWRERQRDPSRVHPNPIRTEHLDEDMTMLMPAISSRSASSPRAMARSSCMRCPLVPSTSGETHASHRERDPRPGRRARRPLRGA